MLSIGRITAGAGYEYLTREVATSRHDYYAGAGEKPGEWWGSGLARLELSGEVTVDQMEALYGQALDPASGEPLGRRFPVFRSIEQRLAEAVDAFEKDTGRPPTDHELAVLRATAERVPRRDAIAALDLTFSPVKSISALWALGDERVRAEVEAAHDAAVDAALGHLQDVAGTTRAGTDGVRTVDSAGWIVARFTHRMSRAQDPQLHTHCAVLNRVFCPNDGRWRTLDSRAVYRLATGGGGIYTRAIEDELTRRLGVRWDDIEPDGPTPRREIAGIPRDVTREWSKRRAQVEEALGELDEAPRTAAARARAAQQATLQTRPAKAAEDRGPHARWRAEAEQLGIDAGDLVQAVTGPAGDHEAEPSVDAGVGVDADNVLDRAVARLEEGQATWRRGNLVRAVAEALPPAARLAGTAAEQVERLVGEAERSGRLVAIAAPEPAPVPAELRRQDGTSVYRPAAATRFTTPGILAAEARLVAAAGAQDPALTVPSATVDEVLGRGPRPGAVYGADQAAAVRAVCGSGKAFELVIGPAGAGKTTTVRALAEAWQASGSRVLGLAVAQSAADVLAGEAGIRAENIARWLATSDRRAGDSEWHMVAGDLVVVDEVGMVPTRQLDQLRRQADAAGAKVVGIGDPLQLGPVGAGGTARLIANDVGATYLHEVHRFDHQWESTASLEMRAGEATAVTAYEAHGRLHGGQRDEAMAGARQAWLRDVLAGRDALLLAASVDQVAELSGWCRDQLVARGVVDDERTVRLVDGNRTGVGDMVMTRRNDRRAGVANRDVWHVDAIGSGDALALRHAEDGRSTIVTGEYASEFVELAYAMTVHAAQGRTADASHLVVTTGLDRELLYVGLTRGRSENHAWVVNEDFLHDGFGGGHIDPAAALRAIIEQEPAVISATEALRDELASADSLRLLGPIEDDLATIVAQRRVLSYVGHRFGSDWADAVADDPACGALVALVRRSATAGASTDDVLAHACRADLDGARSAAQVLAARVRHVLDQIEAGDLEPGKLDRSLVPGWSAPAGLVEQYLDEMRSVMDQRTRALGESVATERPDWAIRQWGPVPDDALARATWIEAAGEVAAYRERWAIAEATTVSDLATNRPPLRATAQWLDHQGIRRYLDLDQNGIADIHQLGPDHDLDGIDDRAEIGAAHRELDDLDAALAQLHTADAALDYLDASSPPFSVALESDLGAAQHRGFEV